MSAPLNILCLAPYAPPMNAAEAIQLQRLIRALSPHVRGTLVSTATQSGSWSRDDASLAFPDLSLTPIRLRLPLHTLAHRLVTSHRLARLHRPDGMRWILACEKQVYAALRQTPDILYSRSQPYSAAILAMRIKRRLEIPWIMHLSDPWAGNLYRVPCPEDDAQEAACFNAADRIALTTASQAAFYRKKYPERAADIFVSPHCLPLPAEMPIGNATPRAQGQIRLVYTGNFYGIRSPEPLVRALERLRDTAPHVARGMHLDVYGHAQEDALRTLRRLPEMITIHGPIAYDAALQAQADADFIVSIEALIDHPLAGTYMPSKIMEALALAKPLLALTPPKSETATVCAEGYGWAFSPSEDKAIAGLLQRLWEAPEMLRRTAHTAPPSRFMPQQVAAELLAQMDNLCGRSSS
jgi:glycosyltransferase involved in cell wall biosynthesis